MKKVYILTLLCFVGQPSWAQIREFQTSRLNSTAGTGVASILSTEAAVLNPASAAFFDGSSASYQTYTTKLRKESNARTTAGDDFAKQNRSQGLFVADHSGPIKGGVAYLRQLENGFERTNYTLHGASTIGGNTAFGIRYNYIQDHLPSGSSDKHQAHHQVSFGTTYVIDEDTTLGVLVVDPTRTTPGEERIYGGFQYNLGDRLVLMADVGAQYSKDYKKKYLWRGAVQANVFSDFFLRVGRYYDNITEFKGTGWGASWIGPKLGVEFAQKISDKFGSNGYVYEDEVLVDTSISAILKF